MHSDVAEHAESCLRCQHRKTSHRPPTLPTRHRPVTKPFPVVAVDLVEYKSKSEGYRFILSVIDHLTRFLLLIPIKSKEAAIDVRHLIDRVFLVFGPRETLHSDQGKEFEKQLVKNDRLFSDIRKSYRRVSSARELCSRTCPQHFSQYAGHVQ